MHGYGHMVFKSYFWLIKNMLPSGSENSAPMSPHGLGVGLLTIAPPFSITLFKNDSMFETLNSLFLYVPIFLSAHFGNLFSESSSSSICVPSMPFALT